MVTAPLYKRPCWQLTAILLLLQLAMVQAMAASSEFHERCHEHDEEHSHGCIVDLMLYGGFDRVTPEIDPVDVISETPEAVINLPAPIELVPAHLAGGVLAHAPPRGP